MTNIYVTRHGQTEWNINKRLQGASNSELTQLGIRQAEWLQKKINNIHIDCIYTSPLKRAYITAKTIKGNRNIELVEDSGLQEISFGIWEGMTMDEIDAHEEYSKELYNLYNEPEKYKPYSGETPMQVEERIHKTLDKILKQNKDKDILIVTHGMTLKFIMSYFEPKSLVETLNRDVFSQASFTHIEIEEGNVNIKVSNDISHYEEEIVKVGW